MKKQIVLFLLTVTLMSCERSEIAPYPTQSGVSAFRFGESNGEVVYFSRRFDLDGSRGLSALEAKGLTAKVSLEFDSVGYTPDTLASYQDHLFLYPHLYTVSAHNAARLQSIRASRWHRSYIAALNENFLVLAGEISGSRGDSVTNLEVYRLIGDSLAVGHIDLTNPKQVALHGTVAYIFDDNKLKVVDLEQASLPRLIKSISISNVTYLSVAENKLVVTSGSQIQQFNIADPREPVFLATLR